MFLNIGSKYIGKSQLGFTSFNKYIFKMSFFLLFSCDFIFSETCEAKLVIQL